MRFVVALLLASWFAGTLPAQQPAQLPSAGPPQDQGSASENPITSLASEFMSHDFFNVYLFANAVYDSEPISFEGRDVNEGGLGFDGGGGIDAQKQFRDGYISLGYRGDYRDYTSAFYPSGTNQDLNFAYQKRLGRRWSFNANVSGGIFLYGGTFFAPATESLSYTETNPFSTESRFLSGGIGLSYRQTRRLSYVFNGEYYLYRYNFPGSIGATGVTGSGSVLYQITARTTLGGTYSYTYFGYQLGAGNMSANTFAGTISHRFANHWFASAMVGVTRTDANGTISVPILIEDGNNLLPGYAIGHYHTLSTFPSVQGTISRQLRRSMITASGGQGITSGNGVYLASKNLFLDGIYSYSMRRSNLSFGGGISHLTSISNRVSYTYTSASFSANYGYNLMRHLGVNARYDYVRYGTLGGVGSQRDNRFTFGVYFSSKSIPLTLF